MSKSLGNGFDPLDIVDAYGADSLRFTFAYLSTQGQDILMDPEIFSLGSRFANKIWNASRYLLMNLEGLLPLEEIKEGRHGGLKAADRWILNRLNRAAERVHSSLESYRFNDAGSAIHEFFWSEYCDWYIEVSKLSLYSGDDLEKKRVCTLLMYLLEEALKLLHPFLPYLTEEIFQKLPHISTSASTSTRSASAEERGLLLVARYPEVETWRNFPGEDFESLRELIRSLRTLRSEFSIAPEGEGALCRLF